MSSGAINPFQALANGAHNAGSGALAAAINHGRAMHGYAAMREFDAQHETNLATHVSNLRVREASHKFGLDLAGKHQDHKYGLEAIREKGAQERSTIQTRGEQERDNMVVGARAEGVKSQMNANADVTRISAKTEGEVAAIKARGKQERKTYGYKARTNASLAPQPPAAVPAPITSGLPMPGAPKPSKGRQRPAEAPAERAQPHDSEAPTRVTETGLKARMKPGLEFPGGVAKPTARSRKKTPPPAAPGVAFSG